VLVGTSAKAALYVNTGISTSGNSVLIQDLTLRNPVYASAAIGACMQGQTKTAMRPRWSGCASSSA
jgi:hypothetical protein